MHNLKKFNMNRKYRVRIRCLTFLVTLFWLPLHAQEAGKEFRPAGEPISYAEKDNRKKSPEPLEDQKDKLKKQRIITAKGRVTDAAGEPLIGVNVLIKESGTGQVTDLNGEFKLPDIRFGSPLRISFIGYKTLEVNARENMRLTLYEDRTKLDEVVIVGYGSQKKANLSGAVSSVSIDALAERPVTNAENALAGLASGLTVTNSGGNTPGFETSTIRIRGVGTLNNADPLVVIDGVAGCAISDINPQDIKNISILKDAASSAIYGSRAANGVILITTKTGYEGSAKITYSGNFSFEKVAKRLNLVTDYADFMEIQNAALSANGQAPRFSQTSIDAWRNDNGANPTVYPNTDWQDHIYRNPSVVQNHNLSAIGGTKTVRYNLSLGYVKNPGIVYNTDYERYQLRSNVEVDIKPWITAGMNIFGYMDSNNPNAENATNGGDVIFGSGALNTVPGMTLYDPETGLYGGVQNPEEENVSNFNPYRRMWFYKEDFPIKTRRIVPKLFARLSPVEGLTLSASFTYNSWERNEEYQLCDKNLYRFTLDGPVLLREGTVRTYINRYNRRNTFRTSDVTARYEWNVSKLNASALVGISQEYNKREDERFRKYDLADDALTSINGGSTNGEIEGNYTEWAMRSYFGRINLSWDDKYLLEVNLRADGSSRFAPDKRWGWFPSVSAGWSISEEPFLKKAAGWLDMLKLRASIGNPGNQNFDAYIAMKIYTYNNHHTNPWGVSAIINNFGNPDLEWQKTLDRNIGLDLVVFNNRLRVNFDYFSKKTDPLLVYTGVPSSTGGTSVPANVGGQVTKGYTVVLNYALLKKEHLLWQVNSTLRHLTSEYRNVSAYLSRFNDENKTKNMLRYYDGGSPSDLWAVRSAGIDAATGREIFLHKDGTQSFAYNVEDEVVVGNSDPKLEGVVGMSFYYKGFSASANFRYRLGGQIFMETLYNKVENISFSDVHYNQDKRALYDRWKEPGDNAKFRAISTTADTPMSSRFVADNNVFSGESISVGYESQGKWLKSVGASSLTVRAYMNDIFRISTVKNERGIDYPFARSVSMSLGLRF